MPGFDYQTLCIFLEKFHGITIRLGTLNRGLVDYGLNKTESDITDASLRVVTEIEVGGL